MNKSILSVSIILCCVALLGQGTITTIAGNGTCAHGEDGGPATDAQICVPTNVSGDYAGNLYFGEVFGGHVRKISLSGVKTTFAGTGGYMPSGDGGPAIDPTLGTMRSTPVTIRLHRTGLRDWGDRHGAGYRPRQPDWLGDPERRGCELHDHIPAQRETLDSGDLSGRYVQGSQSVEISYQIRK